MNFGFDYHPDSDVDEDARVFKAQLPAGALGSDRCLQFGYFGHGDIVASTWNGDIKFSPNPEDGRSKSFGFRHGSDILLLASCIGYLRAVGTSEEDLRTATLLATDDLQNPDHKAPFNTNAINQLLSGQGPRTRRYDLVGMRCLLPPEPTQPGRLSQVGGSAVYIGKSPEGPDLLIYALLLPDGAKLKVNQTASFIPEDVPTIVRLIYNLSMGEYSRECQHILIQELQL